MLSLVTILKEVDHINIVKCYKMLKTKNNIYLVYDYCDPNTSLEKLLKNSLSIQESILFFRSLEENYAKQISIALR